MGMDIVSFLKTDEAFGGLSNMSGEFPIAVNGVRILTSEHLYQALKFPDHPDVQMSILSKPSPIHCKMVAKSKVNREKVRNDWEEVQLEVMEFCLKVKLLWHWVKFGKLLRAAEGKEIVEISSKRDTYWGKVRSDGGLEGENHLGRLLMKLRDELLGECNEHIRIVSPPEHLNLRFLGEEIRVKDRRDHLRQVGTSTSVQVNELRP